MRLNRRSVGDWAVDREECSAAVVQIHLFGGVGAAVGAERVDVGPAKCQAVLAALALSPGSAVPVSHLVEMVWGESPPRTAEKTLQSYVTRLRKGLGPDAIVRVGLAYRLDVGEDAVDVARFQKKLAAGDIAGALEEWTGPPLAGLDAEGLTGAADGLVEQWLGAVEVDLERRVDADAAAAIGSLTELTATYPFREGLWALLMTALYRVGRQADALAAYRNARRHLVDELGVEPGPRLRELESLILEQDARLGIDRSATGSATRLPTGTVTFGFSEIEGATRLWTERPEAAALAMTRYDRIARAAVLEVGGYVFAASGDSLGVAFHGAADGVAWATALQREMSTEPWPAGVAMRPRIGLHTGEAEERGNDYFGAVVNVAARIATAGHGGQILLSGATAALVDEEVLELGAFRLNGTIAEHHIFQLGSGDHPVLRTEDGRRGNLPRRLGRLMGRKGDLENVERALADAPIVTLVGPGGIGKTRLAIAAAQMAEADLQGGGWLVELAEIASSDDVPRAVADALDVKESPGRTVTESIVATLEPRHALLLLDNCEHVIDGAARLAQAIARGCPNICVLATSREGLGLGEEQLIAVAPLEPAGPGVELFIERAMAVDRSLDARESREDIEEICRRLDGVPLAIELAAARIRSLSPTDLVARLDDHLRLLTGGRRSSVERHRTLRSTIEWSYDLLTEPERVLFQRLSIFAGPFDLAAAEMVAADADLDSVDVDDLLGGLIERSMVIVESGAFGRQFRLLETMRQFGAEHLSASGDTDLIAERHAMWCLDNVTRIHTLLAGHEEVEGVGRLNAMWTNLRAAFDWACATEQRQLAEALVRPIVAEINLRNHREIGHWVIRILHLTPEEDQESIAFWLTWSAHRSTFDQQQEGYEKLARELGAKEHPLLYFARAFLYEDNEGLDEWGPVAVEELRRRGDHHLAELAELGGRGQALMGLGRFDEHGRFTETLADRYRAKGPPTLLNWSLTMLGFAQAFQGNGERAQRYFEEAAAVQVPPGSLGVSELIEAQAALGRGDRHGAFTILGDHVDELLEADNLFMARIVALEFVNMMTTIERQTEAAPMLDYLETTNFSDDPGFRVLVADAAKRIASSTSESHREVAPRDFDDRGALVYMRDTLSELVADLKVAHQS